MPAHLLSLGNQILLLHHLDDRQARGRGNRVAAKGVPVGKADVPALLAPERGVVQLIPDNHAGQGRVSAGESLADAQNIGGDPEGLGGKPVPGPSHARDDLVIDHQHVVSGTNLAHLLEVFRGRDEKASGVADGLQDEGRHRLGAFVLHRILQHGGARMAAARAGQIERSGKTGGGRNMHEAGEKGSEYRLARPPQPRGRHGPHGSPVVTQIVGNHLVLGWIAALAVVLAGKLDGRLGGLRSPAEQLDGVETVRGNLGQLLGESNGGVRHGVQRSYKTDPFLLLADGLDDVLVSVTDIDHINTGHTVNVTFAVHIRQVHPPGFPDDQRIG